MPAPVRIAVIGSSTAAGVGAQPPEMAWVNRYRAFLKTLNPANEVYNLGMGGLQSFQLLPTGHRPIPARPVPDPEHNITRALALQPDAIIINLPSNDAATGYGPVEQLANFDAMLRTALAAGIPAWICTTQPRRFGPGQVQIQLRLKNAVLERYGALAINVWDALATPEGLPDPACDAGDGVHLNNFGHELVFEAVKQRDIPGALAAANGDVGCWYRQWGNLAELPPGPVLRIPPVAPGEVTIEVYDALARLVYRWQGALPHTVEGLGGGPGQYWVRVAGRGFYRLVPWTRQ